MSTHHISTSVHIQPESPQTNPPSHSCPWRCRDPQINPRQFLPHPQDSKCPIPDTRILLDPRVFFSVPIIIHSNHSTPPSIQSSPTSSSDSRVHLGVGGYSSSCLLWSCTSLGLPTLALVYLLYLFLDSRIQAKDLFLADFLPSSSLLVV